MREFCGPLPTVMDYDPQGLTINWLDKRDAAKPPIYGIAAYEKPLRMTRSWQLRVPAESTALIIDSPAGLGHETLCEVTKNADRIIVPVLPSSTNIHATSRCIADLLLVAKISRRNNTMAVVANRVRQNTKSFAKLTRFLRTLGIPMIAVLRDSQNYVRAMEDGIGIIDMQPSKVRRDIMDLKRIIFWLEHNTRQYIK